MRLRTIMIIVFCISAAAPMLLFWLWPHSSFLDSRKLDAREYHLAIANGLSAELSRYHKELITTFPLIFDGVAGGDVPETTGLGAIVDNLDIGHVCIADINTGKIITSFQTTGPKCPENIPTGRFSWMKKQTSGLSDEIVITPVMHTKPNGNVIYALMEKENQMFIGAISTGYLRSVGRRISFGSHGHAAIVDSEGKAISHPNLDWENNRKNLNSVSIVQEMLSGRTGVMTFFSPAMQEEMIAGFTAVPDAGWGVMVPQPLAELEGKVNEFKSTTLTIMAFGLLIALFMALVATRFLTAPLEQMIQAMQRIGDGELRAFENIKKTMMQPVEFNAARGSIKAMAEKLRENIDTISRHAYLDGVTGLPNRECFKVLAQEQIERLQLTGKKGAILFLDLDGFKQVNDVYGHRSGDDLLKDFADKIHRYCGNEMKRRAYGSDDTVNFLPARLGGDEFVIFLGNIKDAETVNDFAQGLFSRVFGNFRLHNGAALQVGGSVGGALYPDQAADFDELLRLADISMYRAKNAGKGRFCLYEEADPDQELNPQAIAEDA